MNDRKFDGYYRGHTVLDSHQQASRITSIELESKNDPLTPRQEIDLKRMKNQLEMTKTHERQQAVIRCAVFGYPGIRRGS